MRNALSLFVLAIMLVTAFPSHSSPYADKNLSVRELLTRLDKVVDERGEYYNLRKSKADSVRSVINATAVSEARLPLYLECGSLWEGLSSDSAISVLNEGLQLSRELADTTFIQRFMISRSLSIFNNGRVPDCLKDLHIVDRMGLRDGLEVDYHYACHVVYLIMGEFYNDVELTTDYLDAAHSHLIEEAKYTAPNSAINNYCEALTDLSIGDKKAMADDLRKVIENPEADEHTLSLAHTLMGEYYMGIGDNDNAMRYYAVAAIMNITNGDFNEVALLRLGELLYRLGDTARAYNYLAVALESAVKCDMKFNLMRLNEAFMDVSKAMDREKYKRVSLLTGLVVVLVVLLLLVAKMIVNKRREVKHLRSVEARLARANFAKDTYIAEFMNLCSSYIESLEDYNRMSKRKITAGQTDELLAYMKSGKVIDEQRKKFYDVFDDALLHIFPNYIADVNRLLQPDKQIVTPSPSVLTTELRILALSRLGIDDAPIIARFLGISTNTIYTYRNRLRTRAIDRSTFEEEAKKIGAIGRYCIKNTLISI